ncbi:hypothetical protein M3672_14955 [Microbacterium enclense]|uniref:zinc finger domain-containing protein n=1 Tax=Microbacterium enclense TaxID=993073 RepID=UPI0020400F1E|nr:hypothetical protein [Microbacterium enclense]MCM3615729.1 hypothetical protein [Microbacterium enclense]
MGIIGHDAVGYVFRTDCEREGWSYIGQSTRLDVEHVKSYFGSGTNITEAITQHGTEVLTKRVLASARTATELHYLEMLYIAEARAEGVRLLNGDFGGPRPFPTMQRYLREQLPEAMMAALLRDHEAFHRLIAENRRQIEAAIDSASSITTDDFYAGYERDLRALMDLSHPCPTCGSPAGEVCRTNSKSLTKPRNPCVNHKTRPRG